MIQNQDFHVWTINLKYLRKLSDLHKYKIHEFFLNTCDIQASNSIAHIKDLLKHDDMYHAIAAIHELLTQHKKNILNIYLYQVILDMKHLPLDIATQLAQNLQKIINRMMKLHLEECNILVAKPNHKYSQHFKQQQQSYNMKIGTTSSNQNMTLIV